MAGEPVIWTGTLVLGAVRDTVGDPDGAATERWTDLEISNYVNRAMLVIARDIEKGFETVWTMAFVTDQNSYEMEQSFDRDRWIEWQKSTSDIRELEFVPFVEFQSRFGLDPTKTGEPVWYTFWKRLGSTSTATVQTNIFVYPTPDSTVNTDTMRVYGYKRPEAIEPSAGLANALELDPLYVEAAIMYAAYLIKRDDDDLTSADRFRAEYEAQKMAILDHNSRKSRAHTPTLTPRDSTLHPYRHNRNPRQWHPLVRRW